MFELALTTCFSGLLCYGSQPAMEYVSAERCFQQGAIIAGFARANLGHNRMEQTTKIVCTDHSGAERVVMLGRDGVPLEFPADFSSLPPIDERPE